jgi:hypothetical protein
MGSNNVVRGVDEGKYKARNRVSSTLGFCAVGVVLWISTVRANGGNTLDVFGEAFSFTQGYFLAGILITTCLILEYPKLKEKWRDSGKPDSKP